MERYIQYDSFETKKYDFSVFSCDLTDAFAVVNILLKLAKNE